MFEYQIHIKYDDVNGYEHEITESTLKEAKERRQEYRENCPQYPVKIVRKLVESHLRREINRFQQHYRGW